MERNGSGEKIVVIGDSHANIFGHDSAHFIARHIGPATAHNLAKQDSSTQGREKLFAELERFPHLPVLLIFGEIDCRIHFWHQHRKTEQPIENLIDETIARYLSVAREVKQQGRRVFIRGGIPAARQINIYHYANYASYIQRAEISFVWQNRLKFAATTSGFGFLPLYFQTADQWGFIRKPFTDDGVHLNLRSGILKYAQKLL